MDILLFIGFNIMMMTAFFVVGIHQFMQIEDKQKRRPVDRLRSQVVVSDLNVDEDALRQWVRDEHYEEAIRHLMDYGEVDRYTAEAAVESLKQQEYRPYQST